MGGLIVLIVALVVGPYRWAAVIRSWLRRSAASAGQLASALTGHASSDTTVGWVRRHLDLLRIGGAVLAAVALLVFSVNWVGVLIIAVLLALYEFGLHRLRSRVAKWNSPRSARAARTGGPWASWELTPEEGRRIGIPGVAREPGRPRLGVIVRPGLVHDALARSGHADHDRQAAPRPRRAPHAGADAGT
jgi:hypothetical protein